MDNQYEADLTDHELMRKVALGDEVAFTALVTRHQHQVLSFMMKMLNDYHRAEDFAQMVFVRIWKYAGSYKPDAKFTTYLYTIAKNLVYTESLVKSKRKEVSVTILESEQNAIYANPREVPDQLLQQEELEIAIDRAIAALPEQSRTALILRRYEDMPYEEIAQVLNVSLPALKSIIFRARASLKADLATYLND